LIKPGAGGGLICHGNRKHTEKSGKTTGRCNLLVAFEELGEQNQVAFDFARIRRKAYLGG
jgi:hypothetical protein